MANYDPDGTPDYDPEQHEEAISQGLQMVHVICDEEGAKVGDVSGVSFIAYVGFVPRMGERIDLEDGRTCEVRRVYYRVTKEGETKFPSFFPNIYAVAIDGK